MRTRSVLAALAAATLLAAPAAAQMNHDHDAMPESYRAIQMRQLETQRRLLLSMADSMPERLYRDHATPPQRDFAQQIGHAAGAVPMIVGGVLQAGRASLPDTATAFNSRAGLRAYINACYDFAANALRNQTAAQRAAEVNLFGNRMPGWQVWDEMNQHTFWTAGQIVANFRKNGMAPPPFGFF